MVSREDVQYGMPARRSKGGVWFTFFLFCAAAGAGAYAYRLRTDGIARDRTLAATKGSLDGARAEKKSLEKRLSTVTAERDRLAGADHDLRETKARLAANEARLGELSEQAAAVEARLGEFRDVTDKFKKLIDAGTLDITFRRGRMIVELPAGVLFDSGSAELSDAGKKTIAEVAKVLASVADRRFIVGGHTDNIPAVTDFKSNWALSTTRAVTVLEALVHAGMPATRVAAAGYAEFDPVATNATAEGRQRNRRIEISLEPYLTAIPESDKKAGPAASAPKAAKAAFPAP